VKKQIELLDVIIKEMNGRAEAQKDEAKKLFNASVKDLLDKLKFEEFRSVALNKDYRLYVERFDEKRRDYVKQNASTLSTSEKLAIALILQVALKETYVPEIPFLLVDDVLEDLDEGRLDTILKYLSSKAKESDWFVVATKLVKGQVEPRITILKG
jgi:DNA repair exonuclease SbcCD ATPase subunit